MTKQDWDTLQGYYDSHLLAHVSLKVGDFMVSLQKEIAKNKIYNSCYVDGHIKGTWFSKDYEGPEKEFMYHTTSTIRSHSDKELRKMKRELGAAFAKRFEPKKVTRLRPFYPSFTAFKKQMIATGLPISIITE